MNFSHGFIEHRLRVENSNLIKFLLKNILARVIVFNHVLVDTHALTIEGNGHSLF